jgi:N-acetylglutamate synthase/N-acetylornithine aminotransferase
MAKQVRQHTAVNGIESLLGAINKVAEAARAEYGDEVVDGVIASTGVIGESNLMTVMENTDDAVAEQHRIAQLQEAAEAEAAEAEAEGEAAEADEDEIPY